LISHIHIGLVVELRVVLRTILVLCSHSFHGSIALHMHKNRRAVREAGKASPFAGEY
jgi:hypothetical protein